MTVMTSFSLKIAARSDAKIARRSFASNKLQFCQVIGHFYYLKGQFFSIIKKQLLLNLNSKILEFCQLSLKFSLFKNFEAMLKERSESFASRLITDKASRQKIFNFKILNSFLLRFAARGEHLRAAKIGRFSERGRLFLVDFSRVPAAEISNVHDNLLEQ
jgi:hypothetical protein